MKNSVVRVGAIVVIILLIPLFGNLYIDGWNWSPADFVVMGTLIFIVGMAIDFAARKIANPTYRTIAIAGIVLAFIALWTELAVDAVSQFLDFLF